MRSDLTPTSGRFWSPGAPWNQETGNVVGASEVTHDLRSSGLSVTWAVDAHAPTVNYLGPTAVHTVLPGGTEKVWLPPSSDTARPWQVVVDLHNRTVRSLDRSCDDIWHQVVDLDGDGWGSSAVGLVLEREILNLRIPHAVGLAGPAEFYGRRVIGLGTRIMRERASGGAARALADALCTYGGIFTAVCDERIMVICEHSGSAIAGDQAGLHYRHLGIREDAQTVGISPADLAVV